MNAGGPVDRMRDDHGEWAPIDLLLRQGDEQELACMRDAVAADPLLALELADTVEVVEQLRQLRVDASATFAGKLLAVTTRAERRLVESRRGDDTARRLAPWIGLLAAAVTFAVLWAVDPIGSQRRANETCDAQFVVPAASDEVVGDAPLEVATSTSVEPVRELADVVWEGAVEQVRRRLSLESSSRLRDEFEVGLRQPRDPLSQWIGPQNALTLCSLDHELRASAELRAEALRRRGSLPAVDARVQELAESIADELLQRHFDRTTLAEVAWGVRALIAAGSTHSRDAALRRAGTWLAAELPNIHGEALVAALSGVGELAAVGGDHFEAVATHGQRLLDSLLLPDHETWSRRRPELLSGRVAAGVIGEASRILARLPAFGVDPDRCVLARHLLLGQLREQGDVGQQRPEVLAAMLYGASDLLDEVERERIEFGLRRWRPALLAPDFATVQQLAWGMEPGRRGFTRLQGELRQLAVMAIPAPLGERAAFCLCLATSYAGQVGALAPLRDTLRRT